MHLNASASQLEYILEYDVHDLYLRHMQTAVKWPCKLSKQVFTGPLACLNQNDVEMLHANF